MKRFGSADGRLGLLFIGLAVFALCAWIPFDIDTGMVEKVRRQVRIGDSMLPIISLGFVILGGVLTLLLPQEDSATLSRQNVAFIARLLLILFASLILMRWLGPLAVELVLTDGSYRSLRDEPPWKYIGFLTGGTALVAGLMTLMEGQFRPRMIFVGLGAAIVLILVYDLPFEDLLLPPNGDV